MRPKIMARYEQPLLDDCYRLVLSTMPYSMQLTEQIPNDPPRMGEKVLLLTIIPVPRFAQYQVYRTSLRSDMLRFSLSFCKAQKDIVVAR